MVISDKERDILRSMYYDEYRGEIARGTTRQEINDLIGKGFVTTMYLANGNRLGLTLIGYNALFGK